MGEFPQLSGLTWRVWGDIASRVITPITHIVTLVIPNLHLVTKSPDPPSSLWWIWDFQVKGSVLSSEPVKFQGRGLNDQNGVKGYVRYSYSYIRMRRNKHGLVCRFLHLGSGFGEPMS